MGEALSDARAGLPERSAHPVVTSRIGLVVRTMPAWAWLGAIVVMSAVVDIRLTFETHAPIVFNDELIYSELARHLADSNLGSLGSLATSGYGVVYPLLLAPIYLAVHQSPEVYAVTKFVNGLVFASSAVPAFLIARRLLPKNWSLLVAALAVLGPQAIYSSLVMTENVFFPVFLWASLATVRMLERPTVARQLVTGALLLLAIGTRFQAVALVPGVVTAVVLVALAPGRPGALARLRPYRGAALLAGSAVVLFVAVEFLRGRTPGSMLGAYSVLAQGYSPWQSIKWTVLNLADLDLLAGVALFAILPAALKAALRPSGANQGPVVLGATLLGFGTSMVVLVGIFSGSTQGGHRVHDRYLFYVLPLMVTLGLWALRRGKLESRAVLLGACIAGALPVTLPFHHMVTWAWVDSLGLLPWKNDLVAESHMGVPVIVTAVLIAIVVAVQVRTRTAVVLSALLLVSFSGFTAAQAHARLNGRFDVARADWIDRSVGTSANVEAIYVHATCPTLRRTEARWITLWRAKFFNRSVALSYYVGHPMPGEPQSRRVDAGRNGVLERSGRPVRAEYVLAERGVTIRGHVVAYDRGQGLSLVRTAGPIELRSFSRTSTCRQAGVQDRSAVGRDTTIGP